MRKAMRIFQNEVFMITSRSSFWFALLFMPMTALIAFGYVTLTDQIPTFSPQTLLGGETGEAIESVKDVLAPQKEALPRGFVDPGGLIKHYPAGFSEQQLREQLRLIAFPDQASAERAVQENKIEVYFVIDPDYEQSGRVTLYQPEPDLLAAMGTNELESLINFNLLGGDAELYQRIRQPIVHITKESLAPAGNAVREENSQLALATCAIVMFLFSGGIMGCATLLLNSMTREKENRVIEMLIVSTSPAQLLLGKVAGMGVVGLLQITTWLVSGMAIFWLGRDHFQLPAVFQLRPSFIGWGILYYILGYLLYASIAAGIGAIIPKLREANQATTLILSPVILLEMLIPSVTSNPHGSLAVILSLFPLTAPVMVMMRLSLVEVPLWQMLVSIVLLVITCLLVVRASAGLFRAQTMLTGKGFQLAAIRNLVRHVFRKPEAS